MEQPLQKTVWRFLKKLRIKLPYDLAIPGLGIHPKNKEILIQKYICIPMFTAALLTIAKMWKQPKATGEWVDKKDIYTYLNIQDYYSFTKKKKNLPFVTIWTDLEGIVLSERSEIEKDKYHMISLMAGPEPSGDNGT